LILSSISDDKDSEVAVSEIEGQGLPPDTTTYRINSCGKELNSTDGTEGEYDLVEKDTGELIRHVYWNNPWDNSQPNTFTNTGGGLDWLVQVEGGNHESGELGEIRLTLFRF
jgi:hypothetical protein